MLSPGISPLQPSHIDQNRAAQKILLFVTLHLVNYPLRELQSNAAIRSCTC